jgi:hypothetical protein
LTFLPENCKVRCRGQSLTNLYRALFIRLQPAAIVLSHCDQYGERTIIMQTSLIISIILTGILVTMTATAETPPGMAKATFAVHCYDVGASALDGKPGVVSVERGWSGAREVDRVVYDPKQISLGQLENWLKAAGTYVSTLESATNETSEKEVPQ